MKKIIFTIIVTSLLVFSQEKLEDLVDLKEITKELNCDPVLEKEFKNYLKEEDYYEYMRNISYFAKDKNNNEIAFFCKVKKNEYYVVIISNQVIKEYFSWHEMGEIKFNSKIKINLNTFSKIKKFELNKTNKIVTPTLYISTPDSSVYFFKLNDEWYFRAVD